METATLPSYSQYKAQVDTLVNSNKLTVEQGIICIKCFSAHLNNTACHVDYLIDCTGLGYKRIHELLNGLVLRGAIRRIEKKWYTI